MTEHDKAMEAANRAFRKTYTTPDGPLKGAIAAYLAALPGDYARLLKEARAAFDGDDMPRKNIALRKLCAAIEALSAKLATAERERDEVRALIERENGCLTDAIQTARTISEAAIARAEAAEAALRRIKTRASEVEGACLDVEDLGAIAADALSGAGEDGGRSEVDQLRNDCRILLANLDWMEEIAGEGLEDEDKAIVERIRSALTAAGETRHASALNEPSAALAGALQRLEDECWSLVCKDYPIADTGDADTGWEVISHHQAKPHERCEGFGRTPIEALRDAGLLPAPLSNGGDNV